MNAPMRLSITGRGAVTSAGCQLTEIREKLLSGWTPPLADLFPMPDGLQAVPYYYPLPDRCWEPPPDINTRDPFTAISSAAASAALRDAGLEPNSTRLALVFGSIFGPATATHAYLERLCRRGPVGLSPSQFLASIISMPAGWLSIYFGIRGSISVVSGVHPLEVARLWIASGRENVVVLVASETLSPAILEAMIQFGERDPNDCVWPILSQGSIALVVEAEDHARARSARIWASVLSMTSIPAAAPSKNPWSMSREMAEGNMREALSSAGQRNIDAVCSCANGSSRIDSEEAAALKQLFASPTPIIKPKVALGELLGASGLASIFSASILIQELHASGFNGNPRILVNDYEPLGQFSTVVVERGSAIP